MPEGKPPAGPLGGRHALVTGGSRGIGRAVAATLTRAGAVVTVIGRDETALQDVVASGEAAGHVICDVTDGAAVPHAFATARETRGAIDILIANAGAAVSKPFGRTTHEDFAAMWTLNVMGVVHSAQAAIAPMVERDFGRIVAVASTAGLKGYPYVSAYCAAKHGVIGLVRALALETARTGVTVNAVCPGFTETDLVGASLDRISAKTGRSREEALAELTRHNPQGRLVTPQEVADTVLWLCGEAARSITGQAIAVAGGEV